MDVGSSSRKTTFLFIGLMGAGWLLASAAFLWGVSNVLGFFAKSADEQNERAAYAAALKAQKNSAGDEVNLPPALVETWKAQGKTAYYVIKLRLISKSTYAQREVWHFIDADFQPLFASDTPLENLSKEAATEKMASRGAKVSRVAMPREDEVAGQPPRQ